MKPRKPKAAARVQRQQQAQGLGTDYAEFVRDMLDGIYMTVATGMRAVDGVALHAHGRAQKEIAAARKCLGDAALALNGLEVRPAKTPAQAAETVSGAMDVVATVVRDFVKPAGREPRYSPFPFQVLTAAFERPGPPIMAIALPGTPETEIDPHRAREILEAMIREIEAIIERLRAAGGNGEAIRKLQNLIAAIRGSIANHLSAVGQRVPLSWLLANIRYILAEIARILQQTGPAGAGMLAALANAVMNALRGLGAGVMAAGAVKVLLVILAGLAIGIGIGCLIGSMEIDGKSVWDHIADGMYGAWLHKSGQGSCDELWRLCVAASNARRTFENEGGTDRHILLAFLRQELSLYRQYLQKPCSDVGNAVRNYANRLAARIQQLESQ